MTTKIYYLIPLSLIAVFGVSLTLFAEDDSTPIHLGSETQAKAGTLAAVELVATDRISADRFCDIDGRNCFSVQDLYERGVQLGVVAPVRNTTNAAGSESGLVSRITQPMRDMFSSFRGARSNNNSAPVTRNNAPAPSGSNSSGGSQSDDYDSRHALAVQAGKNGSVELGSFSSSNRITRIKTLTSACNPNVGYDPGISVDTTFYSENVTAAPKIISFVATTDPNVQVDSCEYQVTVHNADNGRQPIVHTAFIEVTIVGEVSTNNSNVANENSTPYTNVASQDDNVTNVTLQAGESKIIEYGPSGYGGYGRSIFGLTCNHIYGITGTHNRVGGQPRLEVETTKDARPQTCGYRVYVIDTDNDDEIVYEGIINVTVVNDNDTTNAAPTVESKPTPAPIPEPSPVATLPDPSCGFGAFPSGPFSVGDTVKVNSSAQNAEDSTIRKFVNGEEVQIWEYQGGGYWNAGEHTITGTTRFRRGVWRIDPDGTSHTGSCEITLPVS